MEVDMAEAAAAEVTAPLAQVLVVGGSTFYGDLSELTIASSPSTASAGRPGVGVHKASVPTHVPMDVVAKDAPFSGDPSQLATAAFGTLSVEDLRKQCVAAGLSAKGGKQALVGSLARHFIQLASVPGAGKGEAGLGKGKGKGRGNKVIVK